MAESTWLHLRLLKDILITSPLKLRAVVQTLARDNLARNPLVRPTPRLPPFKYLHLSFSISFIFMAGVCLSLAEYNDVLPCLFYWSIGACCRQAAHTT